MASQTQGIQQLLTAEKRAAEKVSEARKRKYNKNTGKYNVRACWGSRDIILKYYLNNSILYLN